MKEDAGEAGVTSERGGQPRPDLLNPGEDLSEPTGTPFDFAHFADCGTSVDNARVWDFLCPVLLPGGARSAAHPPFSEKGKQALHPCTFLNRGLVVGEDCERSVRTDLDLQGIARSLIGDELAKRIAHGKSVEAQHRFKAIAGAVNLGGRFGFHR